MYFYLSDESEEEVGELLNKFVPSEQSYPESSKGVDLSSDEDKGSDFEELN